MTAMHGDLPSRIGPYRPVAKLGEGGMGVVYRAVRVDDPSREVALKVILSGFAGQGDFEKRFQRESRILENLRHPNIVSVLEMGRDGARLYLAMELLEGVALSAFIGKPWPETLPLLLQVCLGMEYLAHRRIVHRDISPQNILVVRSATARTVKVLDFGVAKDLEAKDTLASFTETGLLMGKPSYWSPDQLGVLPKGETIDWRCDIYSTGVVFYYILSGRLPIKADSPYSYASAHLTIRPDPVQAPAGVPALPGEVVEVVARMLEKKREDRPSSWREIIQVFWNVLPREARQAGSLASQPPPPVPFASSPSGFDVTLQESLTPSLEEETAPGTTPFVSPPVLGSEPSRAGEKRPSFPPPLAAFVAAVVILVAASVGAFLFLRGRFVAGHRPEPGRVERPLAPPGATAVPEELGRLALQALPWARVLAVTNESTGEAVRLPAEMTTPVLLKLPPGRYRLDLSCGASAERREVHVDIAAAGVTRRVEEFESPREAIARLD